MRDFAEAVYELAGNVDLGNAEADGFLDVLRGNARASVHDKRHGDCRVQLFQEAELQVRVSPVEPVLVAHGHCQKIDTRGPHVTSRFGRIGKSGRGAAFRGCIVGLPDFSDFPLHRDTQWAGHLHHLPQRVRIFFERPRGEVQHHRREPCVEALPHHLHRVAVVQVQGGRHRMEAFDCTGNRGH